MHTTVKWNKGKNKNIISFLFTSFIVLKESAGPSRGSVRVLYLKPQEKLVSRIEDEWLVLHFFVILCLQILPCPLDKVNRYREESDTTKTYSAVITRHSEIPR